MKTLKRIYFFAMVLGLAAYFFMSSQESMTPLPPSLEKNFIAKVQEFKSADKMDPQFFRAGQVILRDYRAHQKKRLSSPVLSEAFANNIKDPSLQIQIDAFDAPSTEKDQQDLVLFQISLIHLKTGNKIAESAFQF